MNRGYYPRMKGLSPVYEGAITAGRQFEWGGDRGGGGQHGGQRRQRAREEGGARGRAGASHPEDWAIELCHTSAVHSGAESS